MSDLINDGGPAFPCDFNMSTFEHGIKGMSLRDWFAGQALQGLACITSHNSDTSLAMLKIRTKIAYNYADAMLVTRNKEVQP